MGHTRDGGIGTMAGSYDHPARSWKSGRRERPPVTALPPMRQVFVVREKNQCARKT